MSALSGDARFVVAVTVDEYDAIVRANGTRGAVAACAGTYDEPEIAWEMIETANGLGLLDLIDDESTDHDIAVWDAVWDAGLAYCRGLAEWRALAVWERS